MLPVAGQVEAMLPRHLHHRLGDLKPPPAHETLGRKAQRESCLPNLDRRCAQTHTTRTIFLAEWKLLRAVEEIRKPEVVKAPWEIAGHAKQTLVGPAL